VTRSYTLESALEPGLRAVYAKKTGTARVPAVCDAIDSAIGPVGARDVLIQVADCEATTVCEPIGYPIG